MSFSGPITYNIWVSPGKSVQEMRVGTNKYIYWANGKVHEESVIITKRGNNVTLEPPKVCSCNKNIYNCSDFKRQWDAQQCYLYCLGIRNKDIHRLDGDDDGRACEALP